MVGHALSILDAWHCKTAMITKTFSSAPAPSTCTSHTITSTRSRSHVTDTLLIESSHDHVHGFLPARLQLNMQQMPIFALSMWRICLHLLIFILDISPSRCAEASKHSTLVYCCRHLSLHSFSINLSSSLSTILTTWQKHAVSSEQILQTLQTLQTTH